jgi:hypothetical protein
VKLTPTQSGVLISSASVLPTFTQTEAKNLDDFVADPLEQAGLPSSTGEVTCLCEAAPRQPIPFFWARTSSISETNDITYLEVLFGNGDKITITFFATPKTPIEIGEALLFVNLYPNIYQGKLGLKIGNRSAYFKPHEKVNLF